MYALNVEYRKLKANKSLAQDLAEHLSRRFLFGKAVVVTSRPPSMLAAVRKQWLRLERKVWIERARTLHTSQVLVLSDQLDHMQDLTFTARPPNDLLEVGVTFATIDDLLRVMPDCRTMYVTYNLPREKLHMVTPWMWPGGAVVIYEKD